MKYLSFDGDAIVQETVIKFWFWKIGPKIQTFLEKNLRNLFWSVVFNAISENVLKMVAVVVEPIEVFFLEQKRLSIWKKAISKYFLIAVFVSSIVFGTF